MLYFAFRWGFLSIAFNYNYTDSYFLWWSDGVGVLFLVGCCLGVFLLSILTLIEVRKSFS